MLFVWLFGRYMGTTAIKRKQFAKVKKTDVIVTTGCCQACINVFMFTCFPTKILHHYQELPGDFSKHVFINIHLDH